MPYGVASGYGAVAQGLEANLGLEPNYGAGGSVTPPGDGGFADTAFAATAFDPAAFDGLAA